ncbi:DapH/DapD/GlmU-related protein [Acinetobacter soli]|uniref:acyltransferase n=1 Tax=Acinetobacter soli TaxID=487316 RepID=UPI00124FCB04|nr:DapH/DapD/GlmU-related protein [Acinetobacter soli]WEH91637.1 DapH/DapD/GlmU-related protein [Acinetobacter soli]WEH96910.1 DapH/DapD/GlmU-related protein [Acinetobacter soli]WEI00166.1 DapH/DapD/GlmU-related protein [Acinetobacter soli]
MKEFLANLRDYVGLILGYLPIHFIRIAYYRHILNCKIGKNTYIHRCCQIRKGVIEIGDNCVIGENALLDGRKGIKIGNNVNISSSVSIYTLQHDYNDPYFLTVGGNVIIENNCWISCNSIILPNVKIAEGAVVGAMSLVNKDVPEYTLVGGVPFKVIRSRSKDIRYKLNYHKTFH